MQLLHQWIIMDQHLSHIQVCEISVMHPALPAPPHRLYLCTIQLCTMIIGTGCRVQVLAWSSIAQSVCQRAFSLLEIRFQRPWFKSSIQERKTTCLLSVWKSIACTRASKLTTTNMYIARARCESQLAVGSSRLNVRWSYGRAVEFKF